MRSPQSTESRINTAYTESCILFCFQRFRYTIHCHKMGDNRELKSTFPEILEQLRGRQNEAECLYPLMDGIKMEVDLESAETCLSIGTGPGQYDIEFIKRCLPNLNQFIAVENDTDCVTQLRSNVEKSLPHLDAEIHQESIEAWKGPDCQVDVILLFHMFYYFEKEDRLKLIEKFQSWLKPQTGVMVVVNMSDEVEKVCSNLSVIMSCVYLGCVSILPFIPFTIHKHISVRNILLTSLK